MNAMKAKCNSCKWHGALHNLSGLFSSRCPKCGGDVEYIAAQHPLPATDDRITHEPCPTCGSPATCRHFAGSHIWDCPECGTIVATVGYPCPQCAVGHAAKPDAFAKR